MTETKQRHPGYCLVAMKPTTRRWTGNANCVLQALHHGGFQNVLGRKSGVRDAKERVVAKMARLDASPFNFTPESVTASYVVTQ